MARLGRYPKELRERAVRMVLEHRDDHPSEWAAISSIATKLGVHRETMRLWVGREQIDNGERAGLTLRNANGCASWSGRTASCAGPTRSSRAPLLFSAGRLQRRSAARASV
jgi:transposase